MNLPFCERLRLHFPSKSVIHFAANVISTDVSIRTEMRRSDTKILLTTNHMIDVIDLQGERNLRILRSLKLSTDSRLWSPALRRDDRCKRPRRLCMQMLTAEFVLSRVMHRTATGGSRRLAELPTDKTDRWKCMANNPVMRNASRNVARLLTRCPYKSLEWSFRQLHHCQLQSVGNFRGWFSNARLRLLSKYPWGMLSPENRLLFVNAHRQSSPNCTRFVLLREKIGCFQIYASFSNEAFIYQLLFILFSYRKSRFLLKISFLLSIFIQLKRFLEAQREREGECA